MCVRMDKGVHNLYTYTHLGLSSMSVDTHMRTTPCFDPSSRPDVNGIIKA